MNDTILIPKPSLSGQFGNSENDSLLFTFSTKKRPKIQHQSQSDRLIGICGDNQFRDFDWTRIIRHQLTKKRFTGN
jgi:hypothetical protein